MMKTITPQIIEVVIVVMIKVMTVQKGNNNKGIAKRIIKKQTRNNTRREGNKSEKNEK